MVERRGREGGTFTDQDAASLLLGLSSPSSTSGFGGPSSSSVPGPGSTVIPNISTSSSKESGSSVENTNTLGNVSREKQDPISPSTKSTLQSRDMTVPTRLPTSPTARPDDDDSQLKPTTSSSVPTSTSHSALVAETGNISQAALLSKTSNTDPAMTFSTTSPANTDPATNTSTTPITLSKRATTTPTTTAYNPPRITRESIEGVIAAFAKGRNLGDKEKVFEIFQALVERYGLDNISPLGVTMIKFKEPVATDLEGDGSMGAGETPLTDVMEIERELVIHCAACVVTDQGAAMLFTVPYPLRSVEDFSGVCSDHLLSRRHQETTKNMIASHLAKYRNYRSGPSKRSRHAPGDEGSSEDDGPLRKRQVSGHLQSTLASTINSSGPSTSAAIVKVDPDPPPSPIHGLSSQRLREMVAINYDLSQTDLNSDSIVSGLGDLLLANNYDAQLELMNPVPGATGGINRDKYEGPPDMQLIAWDGPVKSAVEAMGVLGLADMREPLPGMAFSLTPEQLLAAASIWYMADNPFENTSGFMLCDSVGMGKTCAAMTVFVRDQRGGKAIEPTIILAPAGIQFAVWMTEIRKHMPSLVDQVRVVTTPEEWKAYLELDNRPPIVILSFELLQTAGSTNSVNPPNGSVRISDFPAHRIIVDEFQHLRNSRTRLSKLALSYADEDHVKHVLLLSATPTPSSVCDLYVPLRMIKRLRPEHPFGEWAKSKRRSRYGQATGLIKELEHPFYMSRSFNYDQYLRNLGLSKAERRDLAKPYGNEEAVFEILRDRLSELCKRDLEATPRVSLTSAIDPTSPVLEILEGMRILSLSFEAFYEWCRQHESVVGASSKMLTLMSDSISRHEVSVKIGRVAAEIIRIVEIDETAKILVVGHDNVFQTTLQERLQSHGFKRLTDFHTSAKAMICFDSTIDDREAKEKMLTRFATQHSIPILMGPMVPLSEGKNLQMCNYLFILDCPRSPAAMIQLTGRLVRHGQKRSVAITRFLTEMGPDVMHEKMVFTDGTPLGDLRLPTITYKDLGKHMIRLSRSR